MEIVELSSIGMLSLVVVVMFASMITSITGMAGGVLMFAGMSILIPVRPLVAIHGTVQVFNNAARSWFLKQHIRGPMCLAFSFGAVVGASVATAFIVKVIGEFFPLLLLVLLIAYTLFKPKQFPDFKLQDKNFVWVGFFTGIMGIIVGAIDPLLAVFFLRDDLSKEEVVANKSMMQLVTHLTKIPAYLFLGFSFKDHLEMILILSVAGIVGAKLGVVILRYVSAQLFLKLMKAALMIAGARILFQLINMI